MVSLRLFEQGNVMAVPSEPALVHGSEEAGRRGTRKKAATVHQEKGRARVDGVYSAEQVGK